MTNNIGNPSHEKPDDGKSRIRILVAAHKPYWMPSEKIYVPVQVGAAGKKRVNDQWKRDDEGNHISEKNASFCELTGLYWGWKNLDADIYGLCHYRRYFGNRKFWDKKRERLLDADSIRSILSVRDAILPYKRHYWIETRESQYVHAHHREDLIVTENVLREKYPSFVTEWEHMLKTRSGHICNMFIMRRDSFMEYCEWLFDILFEVEKRLDISGYSEKDRRVFGYLGERLLDVWIQTKGLSFEEVPMITLEKQHWVQKGIRFLQRKWKT